MKKVHILFLISISLFFHNKALPQNLNWSNLTPENKHIINVNSGLGYGLIFGAGYGYQLKSKKPTVVFIDYSFPSGGNLFDDFKTRIGVTKRVFQKNNFQSYIKINGVFRRYQNDFVRIINFGSDISAVSGYYKRKWFASGEIGFDKAIVTHFKHSDLYKEIFPQVKDGWYEPATGGNFYYGLQVGISIEKSEVYLRAGKIITQDFKTKPLLPFYAELGLNFKINGSKK